MSFTPTTTQILLLGAGELGTAFLPRLSLISNTHTTIGVRSPTNQYDIVISATGFGADPSTVLKLANEVLDAGRIRQTRGKGKLWFFPWQWGVDYDITGDGEGLMPLFGAQKGVRDLLRSSALSSNVRWTIVSTGIFMSFLFEPFWGMVDRSHEKGGRTIVRALRDWEHKITVTDVDDIGRVLGRIVMGDVDADNRVVYVAGDTVNYGELASIVRRVTGEEVEREAWGVEYLEEELRKDLEDGIKKYRLVFARDGVWWDKEKTVNTELGMSMLSVEECAEKLFSSGG
ncbi:NAD(P)-binding protein [Setomelanomma holmii]|uniref:NAD(P)-binding protein n=1 Tax=Setomelanomma holmii TaxID=210430 RepID=A0A9P4HMU1_9PLEO|nr:NAD(P)-binding protein [Setomelanomma holmii]